MKTLKLVFVIVCLKVSKIESYSKDLPRVFQWSLHSQPKTTDDERTSNKLTPSKTQCHNFPLISGPTIMQLLYSIVYFKNTFRT